MFTKEVILFSLQMSGEVCVRGAGAILQMTSKQILLSAAPFYPVQFYEVVTVSIPKLLTC